MNIKQIAALSTMDRFIYWIKEREAIRVQREGDNPYPWTDDEILQKYRFCNVHREDDRVTRWIAKNWRDPNKNHKDVWFAMLMARLFNNPETLQELDIPLGGWNPRSVISRLQKRKKKGLRVFNSAYIVSTNGKATDKVEYVVKEVLVPAWENRRVIVPTDLDSLSSFASRLMTLNGISTFMAGQIVADVKYTSVLINASDWHTWAYSGPGSRRGLNRILGRQLLSPWKELEWLVELLKVRETVILTKEMEIHSQDVQNCLCEFDKYERCLWNQGRPKQLYRSRP